MNERQQKLAKAFTSQKELYEFIKEYILDFGIIDTDCTDLELGARFRERENLKEELRLKFKGLELID